MLRLMIMSALPGCCGGRSEVSGQWLVISGQFMVFLLFVGGLAAAFFVCWARGKGIKVVRVGAHACFLSALA
jgi:hypothetical protein